MPKLKKEVVEAVEYAIQTAWGLGSVKYSWTPEYLIKHVKAAESPEYVRSRMTDYMTRYVVNLLELPKETLEDFYEPEEP